MFRSNGLHISDDLKISIGDGEVHLRPSQGLRAVETLLRASTRLMMVEAAESAAPKRPVKASAKRR